ncbi:hypothetical protein [Dethiobacter alkaliphilus]|uniref:hypothetical protein n=1 Tax=Dethiobacter alkaliphilus TaxID=427926 RepID=UPI002226BB63|nr:hypothetical protein [Dethiobacter alkaliphilus]MCW3489678.1 hypothetical protein [Dethiobacter alkaliphilus]
MGLMDHVAAVFKSSSEDAEMIGETKSLIRHMEDELRFLSKSDPQQFAALTREQYVIIVQSIILKKAPQLSNEKRMQCIAQARRLFDSIKETLH